MRHVFSRAAIGLAAMILFGGTGPAAGQPLPETTPLDTWGPAGTVMAVARQGDTLYVGGDFRYVGPPTGPFATFAIDDSTPRALEPGISGEIRSLLALSDGDWIAAGFLRRGPGTYSPILRIDANGQADPAFFTDVSGSISSLATDGTQAFIAGTLFTVNGTIRTGIAAVDPATGSLLPWAVEFENNGGTPEVAKVLAHQGVLYCVGAFTTVNGTPRNGFAAIDIASAALLPTVLPDLTMVHALSASGDTLYAVGRLSTFEQAAVAISVTSGQRLPWAVPATLNVNDIVASPTRVYASTSFTLRALDPITGATIGPPLIADSASVRTLTAAGGVLAAAIERHSPPFAHQVITFDLATGQARPWSLTTNTAVHALAYANGRLGLGGYFTSAGGVGRDHLFALDIRSGRPTSFAPSFDRPVQALAAINDVLVAGGSFWEVNGTEQRGVAAVSTTTGQLIPWQPLSEGSVNALAVQAGTLFMGGDFRVVNGYSRPFLAGILLATGGVSSWLPVPDRPVEALTTSAGALFAAGQFTAVAGGARGAAAAYSSSGDLLPWNPDANRTIFDIATAGTVIGMVGSFDTVGGAQRTGFGLVDGNGAALSVNLPFSTAASTAIAGLGSQFIVGGRFTSASGMRSLFAYSLQAGLLPWQPTLDDNGFLAGVSHLTRYPDLLIVGGTISAVGNRRVANLALFPSPGAGPPTTLRARVSGSVVSLSWAAPEGTSPSGYIVEAGSSPGASNVGRFAVGGPAVSGALGAGTYYVRVRALVGGTEGQASSEMVVTVPASAAPPASPTALAASVAARSVTLSWTAAAGNAESYVIEAGLSPGQSNLVVFDTTTLDTVFAASVAPGTYYVRLRARNAFGVSGASNEVQLVVP